MSISITRVLSNNSVLGDNMLKKLQTMEDKINRTEANGRHYALYFF